VKRVFVCRKGDLVSIKYLMTYVEYNVKMQGYEDSKTSERYTDLFDKLAGS
jgi:hypothetical protein